MHSKLLIALALLAVPAHAESLDPARAADLVVEGGNAFRRTHKLPALEPNPKLARAARDFAEYMAKVDRLAHDADGTQPADRAKRNGYDYCMVAENIGFQYRSDGFKSVNQLSAGFVTGWENSPEHRKNLLDRDAIETGAGFARSAKSGRYYAVQLFGRPASRSVKFSVANESSRSVEYRVGEQRYKLPPRSVRTHDVCAAEPVTLAGESMVPKSGERLAVEEREGALRLRKL